jgi:hypothetical protein
VNRWALEGRLALMGLLALSAVQAEPPVDAQVEINYLLARVAGSGCDFYRNGSWYDANRAERHLRFKYQSLRARNLIGTADDFIEKGATRSSVSGLVYAIRCPGADGSARGAMAAGTARELPQLAPTAHAERAQLNRKVRTTTSRQSFWPND